MMRARAHYMYLDWLNNFLTVDGFAEFYRLTRKTAMRIISIGSRVHVKTEAKDNSLSF